MAWPLSRYQDYVDNTAPAITAAFLHALQDAVSKIYLGTQTVKALVIDGTGGSAATPNAGALSVSRVTSGASAPTSAAAAGELTKNLVPLGWARAPEASACRSSTSASTRWQRWYRRSPSGVSRTWRVVRWNSRTPRCASRAATCWLIAAGDTFTLIAGCNGLKSTCVSKFSNVVNFGGFEFIPGSDEVLRVRP